MPVSRLAKWKTALQMIAIALLLLENAVPLPVSLPEIGAWGLWIAAGLTIVTGYDYLRAGLTHMIDPATTAPDRPAASGTAEPDPTPAKPLAPPRMGEGGGS